MPHRLRSLLLVIALLWQSIGMVTPFAVAQRADQMAHMVVHTQDVDHHHHEDLSAHVEASGGLDSHEHADTGVTPAGLLPSASLKVPSLPLQALPRSYCSGTSLPPWTGFYALPQRSPERERLPRMKAR